ncbi:amino acid adenylation domain-containing protein [Kordia sp.]|uniref:amino acid adenylation domain-containing protein n=1 Tax=Kordia sp. TaxID=1965332 RepID=UPI0025BDE47F|nr:amino acid adenylation domain-containing protein [Kordia sp.]MCH2195464.1 amino acid adenylation domain-containing protein [Kordia sp.]
MNREGILQKAKTEEFWAKNMQEIAQLNASSFFGGVQLKGEKGKTSFKVNLNASDVAAVKKLCNNSEVLIYNYFLNVISKLLIDYKEVPFFLSPVQQFQQFKNSEKIFFVQPKINSDENFKQLFSTQKNVLVQQLRYVLSWEEITALVEDKNTLNTLSQFGFVVNTKEIATELEANVQTLFQFVVDGERPYLRIQLKGEMFAPKVLELFGENFNTLLSDVLANTYEPIKNLRRSSEAEQAILEDINTPRSYFSLEKNTLELFDEQANANSTKIAFKHNDQTISYGALAASSNQMAAFLLDQYNAQKDMLFGVMLSRSIPMVEAILGIWKAGSAYVPVGTTLPDENVVQIIENSQFQAIITDDEAVVAQLERLNTGVAVIHLKKEAATIASYSTEAVQVQINDNDLAYVIYTSGSTGKPKGVMIEHIGMLNHMGAKITEMGITCDSIISQNAPHTFDISVWQLFAPIVIGATGVIYDNETIIDIKEFVSRLEADQITILELVPSYLLEMLYHIEQQEADIQLAFTILILNAETLTKSMVARWLALYPQIPIVNTYGATEVSDDTSHYIMNEVPTSYSVPVMDKPIQHFEVHIVDENFRKVPIGVQGEILLAGPCVGRGYFNDPERTAKAYLQGPIEGVTNCERVYKTGDLGRYMPDGTMEFVGRNDNQVKISGHRIELDAIENITAGIDGIKNAKAVAHTDKQFIALYYLADTAVEKSLIEETILQKLPKYMLPAAIIHMVNFPLTTNGKIDKKALPEPTQYLQSEGTEYVAPETELQEKIAAIWSAVLNVDNVGLNDHFFELGGHSLKLMRLKNEYHKEFSVNVKIKEFFENATLKAHANIIEAAENDVYVAIEKVPEATSYEVSNGQKRLWIVSQIPNASSAYNMPYRVYLDGSYNINNLEKAIHATIARHETLRTVFRVDESGELRQVIQSPEKLNFNITQLDFRQIYDVQGAVEEYISHDTHQMFDMENGPLFRATFIRTTDENYVFYYNIHHIIGDGWSSKVLVEDVMRYYEAYQSGSEAEMPALNIQYKDYVHWENQQVASGKYQRHQTYWTKQFSGRIPQIEFPEQKKRPMTRSYAGYALGMYLSEENSNKLKDFCNENEGSLFMGMLSVWNVLLHKYTKETDIIIGSPVVGREHDDLKNQIGFYMNTLALRNNINPNDDFNTVFQKVKRNTLESYDHQMYPFDAIIEDIGLQTERNRNPLYDIMFSYHNIEERDSVQAFSNEVIDLGFVKAKIDLLINGMEVGNQLYLEINYDSDLFDMSLMKRMLRNYEQLLAELLSNTNESIQNVTYETKAIKQFKKNNLLKLKSIKANTI